MALLNELHNTLWFDFFMSELYNHPTTTVFEHLMEQLKYVPSKNNMIESSHTNSKCIFSALRYIYIADIIFANNNQQENFLLQSKLP